MPSRQSLGSNTCPASSVGKTQANGKRRPAPAPARAAANKKKKKQQGKTAQRRAAGNVAAGTYKGWFIEDMKGALTELYDHKNRRQLRGTQDKKAPSLLELCDKYSGPKWQDDEHNIF